MGEGVRRYKQPRTNACKMTNNQYGGLLIDISKLMNERKLNAFRGGKLVYQTLIKQMQTDHLLLTF